MKKMKDSCFNEFDPNAMSVEAALENILKSIRETAHKSFFRARAVIWMGKTTTEKNKIIIGRYFNRVFTNGLLLSEDIIFYYLFYKKLFLRNSIE